MKIKCPKCYHEWETKSELVLVTCPSCNLKTKNKNYDKEDERRLEENERI